MTLIFYIAGWVCGYMFKKFSQYDEAKSGVLNINGSKFVKYYDKE